MLSFGLHNRIIAHPAAPSGSPRARLAGRRAARLGHPPYRHRTPLEEVHRAMTFPLRRGLPAPPLPKTGRGRFLLALPVSGGGGSVLR